MQFSDLWGNRETRVFNSRHPSKSECCGKGSGSRGCGKEVEQATKMTSVNCGSWNKYWEQEIYRRFIHWYWVKWNKDRRTTESCTGKLMWHQLYVSCQRVCSSLSFITKTQQKPVLIFPKGTNLSEQISTKESQLVQWREIKVCCRGVFTGQF